MMDKNGTGEEDCRDGSKIDVIGAGVGKQLWLLSSLCNDANILANSAIAEEQLIEAG